MPGGGGGKFIVLVVEDDGRGCESRWTPSSADPHVDAELQSEGKSLAAWRHSESWQASACSTILVRFSWSSTSCESAQQFL